MLRNRGVNATERRIRQDVLRAYEYDIFDVPRWRYMETGSQAPNRQPRYRTIPRPVYYHTARSSVFNYGRGSRPNGARRVYLPENEWGSSSVESMIFVRNPRYNTGSYYPNEVFERPFRRDFSYPDGYYSRRTSSIYIDDDEMERYQAPRYRTTSYCPRRPTQLSRKVTRKLSPIFTCDCATTSNVKHLKRNDIDNDNQKTHHNHLSKEANNLSLDIYKILSLLRKADGEEERFSSLSLLQNIHDLGCLNSHSGANLITQRVQISPKMAKKKQEPLEKFKAASGVRSKLEALVSALKQYEAEKMLNEESFDAANLHHYNNLIPSDPPSLEARSFNKGNDNNSSTNINIDEDKQKDMDLQTDEPKTSNKSVCGKIKTKKDNLIVERKSLRSRLSWKKREGTGSKMRKDSSTERLTNKLYAGKFIKTKSKDRIESVQTLSAKNVVQQGPITNKAGLMIKIGGNSQRKKQPSKEKRKEKMSKTWIRKFLEGTKDCKNNNMYIRWNNKAFYTKSSSTVVELVNDVYKQLGIRDYSKSEDISVSNIKKMPKRTTHKSTTKIQKSSNKPKHKQKIKAYMMPQTIVPGPVYMPRNVTKNKTENVMSNIILPNETKSLRMFSFKSRFNTISYPSSNYFEIQLPRDFFEPALTPKDESLKTLSSDEQVYNIVEYETMKSNSIDKSISDNLSDQKYDYTGTVNYLANKEYYLNMVQMTQSLCFPKRSEDGEKNVTLMEPESEPTKSRLKIRNFPDHQTASISFPRRSCSLANKIIEDECLNWMPLSADSLLWSDNCKDSDDKILIIHDQDVSINNLSILGDTYNETTDHNDAENKVKNKLTSKEMIQVYSRQKKIAFSDHVRWKDTMETISESLIGIHSRKPVVLSVFWNLFWGFLKTPKRKILPQDLSVVQPPKTVSEPQYSYKPQILYQSRLPLPQKQELRFEPVKLIRPAYTILQAINKVESEKKPIRFTHSFPSVLTSENVVITKKSLSVEKVPSSTRLSFLVQSAPHIEKDETTELASMARKPLEPVKFARDKTEEAIEKELISDNLSESIKFTGSHFTNKTTVEPKMSSKSKAQSRLMRLVRSSLDMQNEKKIQFIIIPSVPLLQQHLHQLQLLLPVCSVHTTNGEQGLKQHLDSKLESQPQDQISGKNDPQDNYLKSRDENRAHEKNSEFNSEFSLIRDKAENSVDMLSNNMNSVDVHSKLEHTVVKALDSSEYPDKNDCQKTKTCNNKTNKNKHVYVTQTAMGNKEYSSNKTCVALDSAGSIKFSLKVTKGDQVTKISIKNRDLDKVNKIKSTIQTHFEEPPINNKVDPIEESINTIPNKNIKVYINITNINTKKVKNSENSIDNNIIEEHLPNEQETDEDHNSTNEYSELQTHATDDITSCQHNTVHQFSTQHSPSKSYSRINNKLPIYVMESTNRNNIHDADLLHHLMAVDETSSITSHMNNIAPKNNVNNVLDNTTEKIDHKNQEHVVEIKKMLDAMMMLNASDFAEMALLNEIDREHNKTYTSLKKQMLRRKEIVNILSEINIRKRKNNALQEHVSSLNDKESFGELESGDSCSRCNVLTRKLNSHRRVEIDNGSRPTSFNVKEHNNNDNIPYLVNPMQQSFKALENDIFIDKDDVEDTMISKSNPIKRKMEKKYRKGNPICCYCRKNRVKKNHTNILNIKENKNDDIILTNMDPCKSEKSSFTEYKVILKNDDPFMIKNHKSKIDEADILQSHMIKKAVLQIYSETDSNEGCFVAKIPKYLRL